MRRHRRTRQPGTYAPADVLLATIIIELEEGDEGQNLLARVLYRFIDGRFAR